MSFMYIMSVNIFFFVLVERFGLLLQLKKNRLSAVISVWWLNVICIENEKKIQVLMSNSPFFRLCRKEGRENSKLKR